MGSTLDRIRRITARWRYAPSVDVVPSASALPFAAPVDAQGAHAHGCVWIVDAPGVDTAAVLAHEVLGHHAPRALLGRDWRQTMRAVSLAAQKGDPQFCRLQGRIRAIYRAPDASSSLSMIGEADEIVARVAEIRAHPQTAALMIERAGEKRFRAAIGHFRRQVLYLDEPITMDELEGLLNTGEGLIRLGFPWWRWERWWYSAVVPKPSGQPLHPHRPPMSLRESERLLDRNGDLSEGLLSLVLLIAVVVLPVVFFGSFGYLAFSFFRGAGGQLFRF